MALTKQPLFVPLPDKKYMKIILIGAGYMAKEYAKVLSALNTNWEVSGRSAANAAAFRESFPGITVHEGGLEKLDIISQQYTHAIVASSVESLYANTISLLDAGVKHILLEKPGATVKAEIADLQKRAEEKQARIIIAYNRRYYSSVLAAQKLIEEDGGVLSFNFEFTEWAHTIEPLPMDTQVKENWFLANSTHVVDTAFYLGGAPKEMNAFIAGSLSWHSRSAVFAGSGTSVNGALFSYQANWKAPGRWSVEMLTNKRRFIFRPMEKLQAQQIGSVAIEPVAVDDSLDTQYKPGLYLQTEAFIKGDDTRSCTLAYHNQLAQDVYSRIAGY
jgi:predicted dehydrogenase